MVRKLGERQKACLDRLREMGSWHAGPAAGWLWDTWSGTTQIMESLVKRGLATKTKQKHYIIYKPVPEKESG